MFVCKFDCSTKAIETEKQQIPNDRKTRPVLDWFQDCCKNCSLNLGFHCMVVKKDVMFIVSYKAQTTKNNRRKNIVKIYCNKNINNNKVLWFQI